VASLAQRVRAEIQRSRLLTPDDRLLVALSGGPDSVALTHLLAELASNGDLRIVGLAHFNHQLRGAASDEDERFCRNLAASLAMPIEVGTAPVAELARASGVSIEAAARDARYEFLAAAATRLGATRIAVGHTLDDQAETYLLKLLRGAGPRGLAGIHPIKGAVIRPLLAIRRRDVLEYLAVHGLACRHDESNACRDNPRNLMRHELLPWLRANVNPAVSDVLARGATVAREDAEWLEEAAAAVAREIVTHGPDGTQLDPVRLAHQPTALATRVVRLALSAVRPERFFGFEHVEAVRALASRRPGVSTDLPGVTARRTERGIVLGPRSGRARPAPSVNFLRQMLSMSEEVAIGALGVAIGLERADAPPAWTRTCEPNRAVVAADAVHGDLAVRTRRPGDVLRPLGLDGRRKLQDVLVDRKIPRDERDTVPLVVDADDRIVWVVGHVLAHDFRVTERTGGVIILTSRKLGGAG